MLIYFLFIQLKCWHNYTLRFLCIAREMMLFMDNAQLYRYCIYCILQLHSGLHLLHANFWAKNQNVMVFCCWLWKQTKQTKKKWALWIMIEDFIILCGRKIEKKRKKKDKIVPSVSFWVWDFPDVEVAGLIIFLTASNLLYRQQWPLILSSRCC